MEWIKGSPLESLLNDEKLQTLSENALSTISGFVRGNAVRILSAAADSGKGILSTVISLIVAVYLLADKERVLAGFWRLMRAILHKETADGIMNMLSEYRIPTAYKDKYDRVKELMAAVDRDALLEIL